MSTIDLRLPNITGTTEAEQLMQIRSYLYQLTPQINWALNALETSGSGANIVVESPKSGAISKQDEEKINNFNEIKAMIIKSAEVVNSFYDQIAIKLASAYSAVAKDIGSYEQIASADISASADGVKQMFANMQKLEGMFNYDDASVLMIKSDAYVKTGLIYTDDNGTPVYGMEVGQTSTDENDDVVYKGMARFTPGRLAFFDSVGGDEVAYISGKQFYITRGEVTESLRIGGYLLSSSKQTGLAFRWIGFDS